MDEKASLSYTPLLTPLSTLPLRTAFLSQFLQVRVLDIDLSLDTAHNAFFTRYSTLCTLASNRHPLIQSCTHAQLCSVRRAIMPGRTRRRVEEGLRAGYWAEWDPELVSVMLELAASSWLMIEVGAWPGSLRARGLGDGGRRWEGAGGGGGGEEAGLRWEGGVLFERRMSEVPFAPLHRARSGLEGALRKEGVDVCSTLSFSPSFATRDTVKLPRSFTAEALESIGGLQILWTSNLADHLLLRDDDTKLFLFHHVSVLQLHMHSDSSPYPWDLLDETIRTVALLVPPTLGRSNRWYVRQCRTAGFLDKSAGDCKRLNSSERQIERFMYWRDRLVLLKRTFDEAEPRTLRQLWFDDRKKSQWFTFWVAVLVFVVTIFFGVVQSAAAWVQAWASVKALQQQQPG